ncbi:MAG: hypothetical protein JKY91_01235 [Emcibacter sp.]|nr:hypothetical protein [Emcibacter sp.]
MPELPEVETVKNGIIPLLEGRKLFQVIQRRDKLRIPLPDNFADRLRGRTVEKITRRAKYLLLYLDEGEILICHLGMSGKMTLKAAKDREVPDKFEKHDHIILETDRHDLVIYNDPRRFGLMTLCKTDELDSMRCFATWGQSLWAMNLTGNIFCKRSKNAVLRSKRFYWISESLWVLAIYMSVKRYFWREFPRKKRPVISSQMRWKNCCRLSGMC